MPRAFFLKKSCTPVGEHSFMHTLFYPAVSCNDSAFTADRNYFSKFE